MATVAEMMRRIDAVDIDQIVEDSIQATKGELLDQNRAQMEAGQTKEQKPITPLYAPSTIARKKRKGQPYDRVTLKDKGDLYGKMDAQVDNEQVLIGSGVEYAKHLEKKYGIQIFGVGGVFKVRYNDVLAPVIVGKVKDQTGMK